ncbi:sodium/potassium/calcium exchanger 4 isoform X1 [Carassius carassius]|uniref:sodium/potassium/calcium exchanger 4 isoform X1 n=1 Tax=Carassius carassius TaxID=217509 RepID=UPI00286911D7|nr:sodium/potassium/calcium exchanger 4 isoform X1 [Carassius carassius]
MTTAGQEQHQQDHTMTTVSKKSIIAKMFRVRKRREMLLAQVCLVCSLLLVAWGMSSILTRTGHGMIVEESDIESHDHWGRRLMSSTAANVTEEKNCTEPAIHEFPNDIFTNAERKSGGVLLHIIAALYMFLALAIVCDDYFVTSLEKICEKLNLSEDVAGATFMAAGSSAPELFASVIGVFITHGDVGVGTIVGSAVFNILCIIGVCGIFAGQVVLLTWWAVFRDSFFYILSVVALIVFIYDEKIVWWESLVLVLMYAVYILIMKFNATMQKFFTRRGDKNIANGNAAAGSELEDVKSSKVYSRGSVVMVDEIMNASPPNYRFPEAGLRVMITNHFGPKTRLRMASRLIITERQRLVQSANGVETAVVDGKPDIENGNLPEDKTTEEKESELTSPFRLPDGCVNRTKWLISWPLLLILYFTIPNCAKSRWEKYFMLSFILSTVWIAVFSYFMVWMVTIIGYTLGIPDVIMGITFLAAGTSVPDCIASLIVARQGLGDMAVSNTIGSNVFDILVGLGVPWALQTMAVSYGSVVMINSRGLVYSVVLLLGSVALTILGIHLNGWKLDFKLGVYVLVLYAIFLCFSIMIEYNVFTFVNLPMCQED